MTASSAHPWVQEGDSYRCARHGVKFAPPATCAKCDADPGPELGDDIDAATPAPRGCKDSLQLERWFVAVAAASEAAAKRVQKIRGKDFHDEASIAKHREIGIRAMKEASILAARREDADLVRSREKRIRDRAKGASH